MAGDDAVWLCIRAIFSEKPRIWQDDMRIKLGLADSLSLGNLDWQEHVRIDPAFLRPAEVDHVIGDPTKAKFDLDWEPTVDFDRLIRMMVDADLERLTPGA